MITWGRREGGSDWDFIGSAWLSASCGIPGHGHGLVFDGVYFVSLIECGFCVGYLPPDGAQAQTLGEPENIQTLGWAKVVAHEHHEGHTMEREARLRGDYEQRKSSMVTR